MEKNILVAVAWPYANSDIHVGNITGSYLPADIFTRYQRLVGNRVIMVSGSDAHGTPITVRAETENVTPFEVYTRYHQSFLRLFQELGLTYDLFTSTHTENHFKVSQTLFQSILNNGYLYKEKTNQWYSVTQDRFLPDRYIEGTCYICQAPGARGDQCESCGNVLDSTQIVDPRSKTDGSVPILRETEHFYLDLAKLEKTVVEFLQGNGSTWRPNVLNQSLGQIQRSGLHGRPITRDLSWGIPVPVPGWEDKSLYVWFEAVIGYLSASIEWSLINGEPNSWQDWWYDPQAQSYYFIGKDNIPFHAIFWPAQLSAAGAWFGRLYNEKENTGLTLPFNVPANEFMNLEGQKISGSRNWAIFGLDFLSRYDPDPLRYYLTVNMPESKDSDWDWSGFVSRNNDELVATWGNLVNRVLSFAYRTWDGCVPDPGELRQEDIKILSTVNAGFETVGNLIDSIQLRAALAENMRLAGEVNKYMDQCAPWFEIKTDKETAGKSIFTAIKAIDSLKTLFAPFLPFSSERVNKFLGYSEPLFGEQFTQTLKDHVGEHTVLRYNPDRASGRWEPGDLLLGNRLQPPEPLYKKLDDSVIEAERSRLGM